MVRLTKTQTEKQLKKLIEYNDYEGLESFFMENTGTNFNVKFKNGYETYGLLSWAITCKSKECFDWILAHPNFSLKKFKPEESFNEYDWDDDYFGSYEYDFLDSDEENEINQEDDEEQNNEQNEDNEVDEDSGYKMTRMDYWDFNTIVGVGVAINHFNRAPNYANSYYIRSLLNAGVYISSEELVNLTKYSELYNLAIQNINFSQNYLKTMFFNQIRLDNQHKALETYEKIKNNLTPKLISIIIKDVIDNDRDEILKYLINDLHDISTITKNKNKNSDILTLMLYDMCERNHNKSFNNCYQVIYDYLKAKPLDSSVFDAYYFVQIFLFVAKIDVSRIIESHYNNFKQIQLPVDLTPYVKKCLLKWMYSKYINLNYSNLNIILKLGWCKSNVFDLFTQNDLNKIKKYKEEVNYYSSEGKNIPFFYQVAYVFHLNNFNLGPLQDSIFKLLKFDEEIYESSTIKLWKRDNIIDPNLELLPVGELDSDIETTLSKPAKKGKATKKSKKDINL